MLIDLILAKDVSIIIFIDILLGQIAKKADHRNVVVFGELEDHPKQGKWNINWQGSLERLKHLLLGHFRSQVQ